MELFITKLHKLPNPKCCVTSGKTTLFLLPWPLIDCVEMYKTVISAYSSRHRAFSARKKEQEKQLIKSQSTTCHEVINFHPQSMHALQAVKCDLNSKAYVAKGEIKFNQTRMKNDTI